MLRLLRCFCFACFRDTSDAVLSPFPPDAIGWWSWGILIDGDHVSLLQILPFGWAIIAQLGIAALFYLGALVRLLCGAGARMNVLDACCGGQGTLRFGRTQPLSSQLHAAHVQAIEGLTYGCKDIQHLVCETASERATRLKAAAALAAREKEAEEAAAAATERPARVTEIQMEVLVAWVALPSLRKVVKLSRSMLAAFCFHLPHHLRFSSSLSPAPGKRAIRVPNTAASLLVQSWVLALFRFGGQETGMVHVLAVTHLRVPSPPRTTGGPWPLAHHSVRSRADRVQRGRCSSEDQTCAYNCGGGEASVDALCAPCS